MRKIFKDRKGSSSHGCEILLLLTFFVVFVVEKMKDFRALTSLKEERGLEVERFVQKPWGERERERGPKL